MKRRFWKCVLGVLLPVLFAWHAEAAPPESLQTVAERSDYRATSRHRDVMALARRLAERSERVSLVTMGRSFEGRELPLLVVAESPVRSPDAARQAGKLVVFCMGNIHAGEVCGKEALLMLVRELALGQHGALLDELVILVAPIYNADGNERFSRDHRPGQRGPVEGMGQRPNAQGLDLNRDHMKLESPEARALARLLTEWDPAMVIDCHTTNGSHHRYTLTYDAPRHPATDAQLVRYARDMFLPAVSRRMEEATGYKSFFYGNFDASHRRWETYPALPRFSTHYVGLRNRIGILSEAYAYAPFRDRVLATRAFVQHCLQLCAEDRKELEALVQASRNRAAERPAQRAIPIRFEHADFPEPVTVLGYVEPDETGATADARPQEPRDYVVEYDGLAIPTESVEAPFAYVIPGRFQAVIDNLRQHGVEVERLREDLREEIESYRVRTLRRAAEPFQGHRLLEVTVDRERRAEWLEAGSAVVRMGQPLAPLIANLLEPHASDGLTTWNYLDGVLEVGGPYPIVRLPAARPLLTAPWTAPWTAQEAGPPRRITLDVLLARRPPQLGGAPAGGFRWCDDSRHYRQWREGRWWKMHADSGQAEPDGGDPQSLAQQLQSRFEWERRRAEQTASRLVRSADLEHGAALWNHDRDLFYVPMNGGEIRRLTSSPAAEELATFSPDGSWIAFVSDDDLYAVGVANGEPVRLTTRESDTVRNGKADWVYFEEIYRRNWRAYRWSPDSRRLAFQQFDDRDVPEFAVPDDLARPQRIEQERYPLAGQANPRVRLGVVGVEGGPVEWVELGDAWSDEYLLTRFAWHPDGTRLFLYVQDRAQRWLDVWQYALGGGPAVRLLRDETRAWIDDPGAPRFLKDGSFLLASEHTGWRHLYHHAADGKRLGALTSGAWEVRRVHAVHEESGWVVFTGTCDSPVAEHLYRVRLDGSQRTRLTEAEGHHRVTVSPDGQRFVDQSSTHRVPPRVLMRDADGRRVRRLDVNPTPDRDRYVWSEPEMFRIANRDGFRLPALMVRPPDFDPARRYPVWIMTYGGPHAPTVRDSWQGGRLFEQMLAQMGLIVLRVDPRSASGQGAESTWTAYRRLGVQELRDLEDVVDWLSDQAWVDPDRIGLSGHSYGGFLTAYALTHSRRFAAGIAGAPVTDWRNYDTIYTERYMDTPENNADGYEETSVVEAADQLHGRLLLVHGGRDDNVHLANTLQLARALQQADKPFEMMIYPANRHGISGKHYLRLRVDFIRRTMGLEDAADR